MCHWLGTSTMRSPGVELTLADYHSLIRAIDEVTDEVLPVVTIVTHNGGPFRIVGLLVVHHGPSGVEACPHQGQEPRAERVTQTRVRDVDLRAVVPKRDPRRAHLGRTGQGLPHRVQIPGVPTRPSPGTDLSKSTSTAPARPPSPLKKKSCQPLDAGHYDAVHQHPVLRSLIAYYH